MNYLVKYIEAIKNHENEMDILTACPRAKCVCLAITLNGTVWGYNHHVGEKECVIENNHCVSAIHAEAQMVCNASLARISLEGATVVSSERPCQRCLITLYEAGVKEVVYINDYHSKAHGEEFVSPIIMKILNVRQV